MYNFDSTKEQFLYFLFSSVHSSTLDHRTRFFEPCKTIFPLLSLSPRTNSPGGGRRRGESWDSKDRTCAGEIESPFRAVSRRLFRTILAGASSRRKKRGGQRRNGRSVAARRREAEKTHVFRAYVSWRCLPATSRSLRPRRHVLDFFARNSNRSNATPRE